MAEIYTYATKGWPVIKGCSPSMSCAPRCWAKRECHRLKDNPNAKIATFHQGLTDADGNWTGLVKLNEAHVQDPLRWKRPERVAVAYHGDIGRAQMIEAARIFDVMEKADNHLYLLLTKHVARFVEMLDILWSERKEGPDHRPPQHIMVGTSIMSQRDADAAREHMAALASAGWPTWVSYEPAIGPVDWRGWEFLKFMAVGGESGKNARPMHPSWPRASRDFCAANGIRFTFKQWGEFLPDSQNPEMTAEGRRLSEGTNFAIRVGKRAAGRLLDGREHNDFPEVPDVR